VASKAANKAGRVSWSRDGFFIRLTPERKAKLEGLRDPGAKGTPIQAVDFALDLALAALSESQVADEVGRSDSIDAAAMDALSRMEAQARLERENLSAIALQIAGRFEALSEMLGSAMQDPDLADLPSLERWFADESARLATRVEKVAIAEAHWVGKSIGPKGLIDAAFDLALVGADGKPVQSKPSAVARARLGAIHPSSKLGLAPMDLAFYIVGQPNQAGMWTLSAFEREADRSMGPPLSSNP